MILNAQNKIINGNMDFWQRGSSFSTPAGGSHTADRWRLDYDGSIGTFTVSRQTFSPGQTAVPGNPTYYLEWNQTVAGSGSTFRQLRQRIEDVHILSGRRAILTFWAKADSARIVTVSYGQNFGTGGSPSSPVVISGTSVNLTTSWQKFRVNVDIPSISGKTLGTDVPNNSFLEVVFDLPINTTMTIDLAEVMINDTHGLPAFVLAGRDYAGELILCQRYYEKSYNVEVAPGTNTGTGATAYAFKDAAAGITTYWTAVYKVRKRIGSGSGLSIWSLPGTANNVTNITQANTQNDVAGTAVFQTSEINHTLTISTGGTTAGFAHQWAMDAEF